jgi:hypothetical protein
MTDKSNVFRRILDALVEGRQRTAQRYVDNYMRDHPAAPVRGDKL